MNMQKRTYVKPAVKRLDVIDGKVNLNGREYDIEEIVSSRPRNRYYIAHSTLYMKISHTHVSCAE
jgi:hypothetical protein